MDNGTVRLCNATNGKLVRLLESPKFRMWSDAFSLDGKRLATADHMGIVKIWDVATGRDVVQLHGHVGTITAVAFSPHGSQLVTSSLDNTVKVWNATSGEELLSLRAKAGTPWGVTFSPDGTRLIITFGPTITVIAVRLDELVQIARSRVTRSLTTEECQRYLHLETCPSEP
jgi:WD40 repeat protein